MTMAEIFSKSSWIETEANGGLWGDWMLNWMRSQLDRMRPINDSCCARRGALGFANGTSGQALEKLQRARAQSDAVARPIMIDRTRPVKSGSLLEMTER
jgi:hypothetical protein